MGDQDESRQKRVWRRVWTGIARCVPSLSDMGALFLLDPTGLLSYEFVEPSRGDDLEQLWSEISDFLSAR